MAVNLTPQYLEAEAEYKKAQTAEERLACLKRMWTLVPKHKASEKLQAELKKKMSDPSTFGIAKSFVMMGMERGFDLSSEEGINQWMATYNAEVTTGTELPIPLPGERSAPAQQFRARLQSGQARNKRKKNRKRK